MKATRNNPQQLSDLLDAFMMLGTDAAVARECKISRTTLWRFSKWSEEGHPDYQECDWGGVIKPYHMHLLDALDAHVTDIAQELICSSAKGRHIPMVHSGAYQFEDCEYAMSLTAKEFKEHLEMTQSDRDLLDYPRVWEDKKRRVQNPRTGIWERVRATQFVPPSLEAQAKVLSAMTPDVFGDRRKVDVTMNASLGVTVGLPFGSKPPVEVGYVQTVVPEIGYIDAELVPAEPMGEPEPMDVPSEPMAVETTPEPTLAVDDTLDAEQRAILDRLKSPNPLARDLALKADQALKRRIAAGDPDLDPARTGYGKTSGYKVI